MNRCTAVLFCLAACSSSDPKPDAGPDAPEGEAVIIVNPMTIDFGDVGAGVTTSPFVTLTVVNKGQLTSGPVGYQFQFTDAPLFKMVADGCTGAHLPPLGECSMSAQFRPDTPSGGKQARLYVFAAPGGEVVIPLAGNAVVDTSPKLAASTASANFGIRAIGSTSPVFPFTITNVGMMPTGPIVTGVTGANPSSFGVNTTCSGALAPQATCMVSTTFRPQGGGAASADLTIMTSPGNAVVLSLAGTGAAIAITATPVTKDFGVIGIGIPSAPTTITVRNNGTAASGNIVTMFTGNSASEFGVVTDNCSNNVLAAGGQCTMGVRFYPQTPGMKGSDLVIDANGSTATVALNGVGVSSSGVQLVASPNMLNFGSDTVGATTAAQSVMITNNGAMTSGTISVTVGGSAPTSFNATSNCTTLAPGTSCTVMVTFSPQVQGGQGASIAVAETGGNSATISVAGNGL